MGKAGLALDLTRFCRSGGAGLWHGWAMRGDSPHGQTGFVGMWHGAQSGTAGMGLAAVSEGILSGTPIATPQGWRAVEALSPGDMVLTFDAAAQRLREVAHLPLPLDAGQWPRAHWPLRVPVGALGNRVELQLLPEQRVLIEADAAEHFFGDPFAVIPAAALLGFRGIDLCRPESGAVIVRLGMPGDQVIYAGRGALLACPDPELTLRRNDAAMQAGTAALGMAEARALVCYLQAAEGGAAFIRDPEMARQAAFF